MNKTHHFSIWEYLLFPGIAMLLGWGLRGYIGGGPFGAMIPGAMVALAISMLLGFRPDFTSLVVVFGVVGIGLGGEMTYGQTLGFLRNSETVWWGNLGTTVKGTVWGLGGGAILGLGLIQNRIPKKTIILAFVFLLIGLLAGFKLINDPKLIYFSDPLNNPRAESWGALLVGSLALITYLKYTISKDDFRIIRRFALWGLISGGLGFGLGGLWLVLGSHLPDVMFKSWWKMMEFTFGQILGMGLGYAAWLSRKDLKIEKEIRDKPVELSIYIEMTLIFLVALFVYLAFPLLVEPLAERMNESNSLLSGVIGNLLRIAVNYAFYGFVMIVFILYKKELAWQIGITLTFCHTMVDWTGDLRPQPEVALNPWIQFVIVVISTLIVAYAISYYRRKGNINNSMFQVLLWSTIAVAFLRLASDIIIEGTFLPTDLATLFVGTLFVHIVFLSSAIYVSWKSATINKVSIL